MNRYIEIRRVNEGPKFRHTILDKNIDSQGWRSPLRPTSISTTFKYNIFMYTYILYIFQSLRCLEEFSYSMIVQDGFLFSASATYLAPSALILLPPKLQGDTYSERHFQKQWAHKGRQDTKLVRTQSGHKARQDTKLDRTQSQIGHKLDRTQSYSDDVMQCVEKMKRRQLHTSVRHAHGVHPGKAADMAEAPPREPQLFL